MSLSPHYPVFNHYHNSSWRMAYIRKEGGITPSPLKFGMLTAEPSSKMKEICTSSATCHSHQLPKCPPPSLWLLDKSFSDLKWGTKIGHTWKQRNLAGTAMESSPTITTWPRAKKHANSTSFQQLVMWIHFYEQYMFKSKSMRVTTILIFFLYPGEGWLHYISR